MNVIKTRIFAALLSVLILAALPFSAYAADYQTPYNAVKNYLMRGTPGFGSVGGEWTVFMLARSGKISPESSYAAGYYEMIEGVVSAACAQTGSGRLDKNKATENSRLVIALTSIGRNARSVAGYDIVAPLTDQSFVKKQGTTGVAFALLALDTNSVYGESSVKNAYVDFLLGRELDGGGWSLGTKADPDVTGVVLTALAPYSKARQAIERGVNKLSEMQNEKGGFETVGVYTCESCAQVVTGLSTVGVDADTDSRFIKNGISALEALFSFYKEDGMFAHLEGGVSNRMATEQAGYALCAYDRMKKGKADLYDMEGVSLAGVTPEPTATPKPTPTATPKPTPTATPKPADTAAPTAAPTAVQTASAAPTSVPTQAAAPTAIPTNTPAQTTVPEPTAAPDDTGVPSDIPVVTEAAGETEPVFTEEITETAAPAVTEAAPGPDDTLPAVTQNAEENGAEKDEPADKYGWLVYAGAGFAAASVLIGVTAAIARKKKR